MRSHPLPLLPFDRVGAEQLAWDGSTGEITFASPVGQTFRCAHDGLHWIEIFIEPTFHLKRSHLWLFLFQGEIAENAAPCLTPIRIAGPLATESLHAHGWLAFEFDPVLASAGKTFSFVLQAPDAAPGNALSIRAATRTGEGSHGRIVAGRREAGALTFRAACLLAPALHANFHHFRRRMRDADSPVDYQPLMVRLEISRPCNLHCVMCQRGLQPFDARREAPGFMSLATARRLDPILPTLLRVIAFGLGEPFLNPQYLEILRHVRAQNPFAHIFTSTNGTCLGDEAIAAILDRGLLSELQISLDGAERETFERIRQKASFDTVVGAFERVAAARSRRNARTLSVTGAMLVMKPNFKQVRAFVRRMIELGVDRISLDSPKDATFKPLRADSDAEMAHVMEQVAEATELLAGTDVELSGPLLSELLVWHRDSGRSDPPPRFGVDECAQIMPAVRTPDTACGVPWESFSLSADGAVHVCCNSYRRMGHAHRDAVGEVWAGSPAYQELRGELRARALHQDCRACIGENFVVPGQVTPAIYVAGCVAAAESTRSLAQHVGRPVPPMTRSAAAVHDMGLDPLDAQPRRRRALSWRISGWIETSVTAAPASAAEPLMLAVAVDGIVRGFTSAIVVANGFAQWSAVVEGTRRPTRLEQLEVFVVAGGALVPTNRRSRSGPSLRAVGGAGLHGFVDEVNRTDDTLHFIGWARDRITRAPARHVAATVRGKPVRILRPWLPRPDVSSAFGDPAARFGYSIELPLALAQPDAIALFAIDEQGTAAPLEWSEAATRSLATFTRTRPGWRRACANELRRAHAAFRAFTNLRKRAGTEASDGNDHERHGAQVFHPAEKVR